MEESKQLRFNIVEDREDKEETRRAFFRFAVIFLLIFTFIATVRTFIYQSVEVEGSSMEKTLSSGDVLVVDKTLKIERGEVVVFRVYGLVSGITDTEKMYIKRVIGIPGDTIWTENGIVHRSYEKDGVIVEETLNEPYVKGRTWRTSSLRGVDLPAVTVPENCYYLMGDNRENSYDSRGFGKSVDRSFIVGVVPEAVIKNKENKVLQFFMKLV